MQAAGATLSLHNRWAGLQVSSGSAGACTVSVAACKAGGACQARPGTMVLCCWQKLPSLRAVQCLRLVNRAIRQHSKQKLQFWACMRMNAQICASSTPVEHGHGDSVLAPSLKAQLVREQQSINGPASGQLVPLAAQRLHLCVRWFQGNLHRGQLGGGIDLLGPQRRPEHVCEPISM